MRKSILKSRPPTAITERLEGRQLFSHTLQVGPTASFHTIQSAVNAASPGDTIVVAPGTYVEQVTIPGIDNGLTIQAKNPSKPTIIQAPSVMSGDKAIVNDAQADYVHITGFTIQGPGGGPNGSIKYGVLFDNGWNCELDHCTITHIHDNPTSGNSTVFAVGSIGGAGVHIHDNVISDYQQGGIVVNGIHSAGWIDHNTVTGLGPTSIIVQNGIEFINGGFGTAQSNVVTGNVNIPHTGLSTGILLFNSGEVYVLNNLVYNNDSDIVVDGPSRDSTSSHAKDLLSPQDGSQIIGNVTYGTTFDGIDLLDGANSLTVQNNFSYQNGFDGIFLDASTYGNQINHNFFFQNNQSSGGGFDIEDLTYNQSGNKVKGTAKTANFYSGNSFTTSNDPKLKAAQ